MSEFTLYSLWEDKLEKGFIRCDIPSRMHGGIRRYVLEGITLGDFLTYVFHDSLKYAAHAADEGNQRLLMKYAQFIMDWVPTDAQGSEEKFTKWCRNGGCKGLDEKHEKKKK